MSTIRAVIADDESIARERVRRLLRAEPDVELVGECADGPAAVALLRRVRPDLLFLDVQMPGLDGFEVLAAEAEDRVPAVILVTAFDEYALRAFDVQVLDYLLKPFSEQRFSAAVQRARVHLALGAGGVSLSDLLARLGAMQRAPPPADDPPDRWTRLLVKAKGTTLVVPAEAIDWIEAAGNYVHLHVEGRSHLLRETIHTLEARLDPAIFARVHRSAIVNLDRVQEIQQWYSGDGMFLLRSGARVRVSRTHRERLVARLRGRGLGG